MWGLLGNPLARAPDGTFTMWANVPRVGEFHARCVVEKSRGTRTTPIASSQLRSSPPEMGRTGGSGPSGSGSSQSDHVDERGTAADEGLRSRDILYRWELNSLGVESALDNVSLDDLGQRLATGKKMQPQLAGAHARLCVHVLGISSHAMGEHRPNGNSVTPNSFLRAIKLWYLMPALLHSPECRIKRRQRFPVVESGNVVLLFPRVMVFTSGGDSRQRDGTQKASEEERSSNGRHPRVTTWEGVKVAAHILLAEQRSAGNKETCNTLVAKFLPEDHATVTAPAAEAVLASATGGGDGNSPPWRPDCSDVLFGVISSRSALSGPGNDGQPFAHR